MRAGGAVSVVIVLSLLAGCQGERQPGPPVPIRSFVLHDVEGGGGGHAIWTAEDRTAYIQVVRPGRAGESRLVEKRYKTTLTAEQWAEVERLVGAHHVLTATVPERPGIPGEAHPIIVVVPKAGAAVRLCKMVNDRHPDFDPVYSHLLGLCQAGGEVVREGAFEWEWRPDGFERPW